MDQTGKYGMYIQSSTSKYLESKQYLDWKTASKTKSALIRDGWWETLIVDHFLSPKGRRPEEEESKEAVLSLKWSQSNVEV